MQSLSARIESCKSLVLDAIESIKDGGDCKPSVENLSVAVGLLSEILEFAAYQNRSKGKQFEVEFASLASGRGLEVKPRTDSLHDWVVNSLRVQCKNVDGPSCFITSCIMPGRSRRGYSEKDFDVLAIKRKGVLLIIPSSALVVDKKSGAMTNHLRFDEWMSWKDRWEVFGGGVEVNRESQLSLF